LIDETREPVISGRSPVLDPDVEPGFAIARGIALHKLLQMLPTLPAAERTAAGRRYLERAGAGWPAGEREAALVSVEAILASPRFSPLFAEGSRAEVSVMGRLKVRGKERAISGTIDRLAITAGEVQIVDYKSNRPAPQTLEAVPPAYIVQLALYRALLAPLYPGKTVMAALLFTEEPRLIELPAEVMDEALVRLTQA
jgi:ATP-dependent helicase/nuclease subunit A